MTTDEFGCPVCGYLGLLEPAWRDDEPSEEICPCCGTQFGYDDATGRDPRVRSDVHRRLRREWIAAGSTWFSAGRPPPPGWEPAGQLERVR